MKVPLVAPPPPPPPRRLPRRRIVAAVAIAVVLVLVAYGGVSAYVYDQLTRVTAKCPPTEGWEDVQDPTSFIASTKVGNETKIVDTTPYLMPAPQTVSFPARDDPMVTIAAWWEPVTSLDAPTVVVVHGLDGCRRNSGNLLVAGMLHKHGIAVLLIDLRNHGDSTVVDGRYAGGNTEYRDVLGAFDWLRAQGVPAGRIGLFGFSLGAAAVMIAAGQEPQVAAVWADSSFAEIRETIRDELSRNGFPTFFDAGAVLVGKVLTGVDIAARSPLDTTAHLDGRPIFLTQGALDERLSPRNLDELVAGVRQAGGITEPWLVPDAGHTQAHFLHPAEYEQRLADFFLPALRGVDRG